MEDFIMRNSGKWCEVKFFPDEKGRLIIESDKIAGIHALQICNESYQQISFYTFSSNSEGPMKINKPGNTLITFLNSCIIIHID